MFVPLSYNLRSLFVRRSATALTVLGIAATVAVLAGVLALNQGFTAMFSGAGREELAVFLRPGATNEGDSVFRRDLGERLIKTLPEIATNADGSPQASLECFLGIRRTRVSGGDVYVPIRGVQPQTFELRGPEITIVSGRNFTPGSNEVIVGRRLEGYVENCFLDDVMTVNTTPFRVVGIFASEGSFQSEVWGDLDRVLSALDRDQPNRALAMLKPGTDVKALNERLKSDPETPAKVASERDYLTSQTAILSGILLGLGSFLAAVMGLAAVFTATNTMLAAIAARTQEIGVLLSLGFKPVPIFLSFLFESLLLGLFGGLLGALIALLFNGIETGGMNFQTFTEVAFAFRVTPKVLLIAVGFATLLGVLGGTIPAWNAARLTPTEALRRG
jgi:putative ABC transport system permease protein